MVVCNAEILTSQKSCDVTLPLAKYWNINLALEPSFPALFYINIPFSNFRCATLISAVCLSRLPHKSSSFCAWAFNLGAEPRQCVLRPWNMNVWEKEGSRSKYGDRLNCFYATNLQFPSRYVPELHFRDGSVTARSQRRPATDYPSRGFLCFLH
jgi:hypothetical protein